MEPFKLTVADPPWPYKQGGRGSSKNHYKSMPVNEICALPVSEVMNSNSVLLLWCTNPMLAEGLKVMKAWGFEYKTKMPWVKTTEKDPDVIMMGGGMWVRGCTEDLLIGVRGNVRPPEPARRFLGLLDGTDGGPGWLSCPRYKPHSRKPMGVYEIAETLSGPYLELFTTVIRYGWTQLGDAVDGRDINDSLRDLANAVRCSS